MSAWQVNRHKYGEKVFVLVGMGMTLRGEVWRGSMKGDTFWGIKALEHPQARERVVHNWKSPHRHKIGTVLNSGTERRFVVLEAPDAAQVVLRFDKPVPTELIRDFRIAFAGPQARATEQGDRHEVDDPEAVLDPSLPPGGHRPGQGDDPDREAAQDRRRPRLEGLEQVSKPPKPKRRKGNASRKPGRVRKGGRGQQGPR